MEAIIERVAGVDVGQATVVVTVLVGAAHERARKETRTFRTVTRELLELRECVSAAVDCVGGSGIDVEHHCNEHIGALAHQPKCIDAIARMTRGAVTT